MQAALQDQKLAQELVKYQLPDPFPSDLRGLLNRRLGQLERNLLEQPFLARSIVFEGAMIGAIGFHAKPDARGRLEVGYRIFPAFRRQGFALEAVKGLFEWAKLESEISVLHEPEISVLHEPEISVLHEPEISVLHESEVKTFVVSVSPTNAASLALIAKLGFVQIARQWDSEDGEELVFELPVQNR
jgi:[ribosomal protein S5]-alanine N-acetyltransferase